MSKLVVYGLLLLCVSCFLSVAVAQYDDSERGCTVNLFDSVNCFKNFI